MFLGEIAITRKYRYNKVIKARTAWNRKGKYETVVGDLCIGMNQEGLRRRCLS